MALYLNEKRLAEKNAIGIIVDADDNPTGTAQALRDHLNAIAGQLLNEGEWSSGPPRLGFFVVPDAETPGELETLVWNSFPEDSRFSGMKEAVNAFHETMKGFDWEAKSPHKGYIGTFLSAANDEDPRLGPAARQRTLDFASPGYARLRRFLEGMRGGVS